MENTDHFDGAGMRSVEDERLRETGNPSNPNTDKPRIGGREEPAHFRKSRQFQQRLFQPLNKSKRGGEAVLGDKFGNFLGVLRGLDSPKYPYGHFI